jgi:hypothetical protein
MVKRKIRVSLILQKKNSPFLLGVVVVWGLESGCTAACRLIVHTPCVFNVPTFTARSLHVTTSLEILAAKYETCWARNFPVIWPKVASSTLL